MNPSTNPSPNHNDIDINELAPQRNQPTTHGENDDFENLYDVIYGYNRNIRHYNENMNLLITQLTQLHSRDSRQGHRLNATTIGTNNRNTRYSHSTTNTINPFSGITNRHRNISDPILISFDLPLTTYDIEENEEEEEDANATTATSNTIRREYRRTRNFRDASIPILTEEEIQNSIQDIPFTEDLIGHADPITLEEFNETDQLCKIILCGHIFKRTQLLRWFQRNSNCPVCRRRLQSNPHASDNGHDRNEPHEHEGHQDPESNTEENSRTLNYTLSNSPLSSLLTQLFTNIIDGGYETSVVSSSHIGTTRINDRIRPHRPMRPQRIYDASSSSTSNAFLH